MHDRPTGVPSHFIQLGPNEWCHPSWLKNRPALGQVQTHVTEREPGPLVRVKPKKEARPKSVARSRPAFRIALVAFRHRLLDDDNGISGMKPIRDEIAQWLGMNDSSKNIRWEYAQCQTSGAEGVAVKIEKI